MRRDIYICRYIYLYMRMNFHIRICWDRLFPEPCAAAGRKVFILIYGHTYLCIDTSPPPCSRTGFGDQKVAQQIFVRRKAPRVCPARRSCVGEITATAAVSVSVSVFMVFSCKIIRSLTSLCKRLSLCVCECVHARMCLCMYACARMFVLHICGQIFACAPRYSMVDEVFS